MEGPCGKREDGVQAVVHVLGGRVDVSVVHVHPEDVEERPLEVSLADVAVVHVELVSVTVQLYPGGGDREGRFGSKAGQIGSKLD